MSPEWFPGRGQPEEEMTRTQQVDREVMDGGRPFPEDQADRSGEERLTMPLSEDQIMEALREVYDPELAINIVDLGLVYEAIPEGRAVTVRMTLTSPGCPVGPMLQALVDGTIRRTFPQVEDVSVEIVWNPPWDPYTMASEEAKDMLGIW